MSDKQAFKIINFEFCHTKEQLESLKIFRNELDKENPDDIQMVNEGVKWISGMHHELEIKQKIEEILMYQVTYKGIDYVNDVIPLARQLGRDASKIFDAFTDCYPSFEKGLMVRVDWSLIDALERSIDDLELANQYEIVEAIRTLIQKVKSKFERPKPGRDEIKLNIIAKHLYNYFKINSEHKDAEIYRAIDNIFQVVKPRDYKLQNPIEAMRKRVREGAKALEQVE